MTIPMSSLPSDYLSPSDQCFYVSVHTEAQACVQGQAFTVSDVTVDQHAIQGTMTVCPKDWPWKVTLCVFLYL